MTRWSQQTFLAKQVELEAIESDPYNDDVISEDELCKQVTAQACEVILL